MKWPLAYRRVLGSVVAARGGEGKMAIRLADRSPWLGLRHGLCNRHLVLPPDALFPADDHGRKPARLAADGGNRRNRSLE